jgi:glutathione synthase/RimK-type ligase-like ATP-grasp enzyme
MRILYFLERIIYPLLNLNILGFIRFYKKNSDVIVVSSLLTNRKFSSELIAWEFGFINGLIKNNISFSYGKLDGSVYNKKILWSPIKDFDKFNFINYPATLSFIASQLESQGNKVFVSSNEVSYLENKYYMHEMFEKHSIRTPQTWIFKSFYEINFEMLEFPLLYKGVHSSGSLDIIKFDNLSSLKLFINDLTIIGLDKPIVLQKLLNIRRDMRVTVLGNEILYSFWRINPNKEWMTTATKNGSYIEFIDFPFKWKNFILDAVKKLNLDIAGLDIAFDDDNLDSEPFIIEISPRFSQNPPYDNKNLKYKDYKRKVFLKNSFRNNQTKVHINLGMKYISHLLVLNKI